MTLKEQLEADVGAVFLNPLEFGEVHTVDDKETVITIDDYELSGHQRQAGQCLDGIYVKRRLIYVAADFGPLPVHGAYLTIDNEGYTVIDAVAEGGVYKIAVEANASR